MKRTESKENRKVWWNRDNDKGRKAECAEKMMEDKSTVEEWNCSSWKGKPKLKLTYLERGCSFKFGRDRGSTITEKLILVGSVLLSSQWLWIQSEDLACGEFIAAIQGLWKKSGECIRSSSVIAVGRQSQYAEGQRNIELEKTARGGQMEAKHLDELVEPTWLGHSKGRKTSNLVQSNWSGGPNPAGLIIRDLGLASCWNSVSNKTTFLHDLIVDE